MISNKFRNMALLCSFMVVCIHCASKLGFTDMFSRIAIYDGVCRMAVPFFFMASGYFLAVHCDEEKWWRHALISRIRTLIVPYFAWISLFIILHVIIVLGANIMAHANITRNLDFTLFNIVSMFGFNPFKHPILQPLWYIRALFILVFLSGVLVRGLRYAAESRWGGGRILLLILFIAYGCIGRWEGLAGKEVFFFRKFFAMQGLFYFCLGLSFRFGIVSIQVTTKKAFVFVLVGVLAMMAKIWLHWNQIEVYRWVGWFAIPFLLIGVWNLLPGMELPGWLASSAFPVYVLHMFIIDPISCLKITPFYDNALFLLLIASVIFLMSVSTVVLARYALPKITGVLFGNR